MSDSEGRAPIPKDVEDGEHKLLVTKGDEYVKTEGTFVLDKGEVISTPQLSLPKKVDFERIKIVLDWGESPYDLDAHIVDSNFHVYYGNMKKGKLELDIDDVSSFGPETITIKEPSVTMEKISFHTMLLIPCFHKIINKEYKKTTQFLEWSL